MWILIVGGLLLLLFAVWGAQQQNQGEVKKANDALSRVPNFRPAITQSTGWNKPSVSIDPASAQFAIVSPNTPPKVYRFDQLVAVEITRDGTSVTKTNKGSQIAGAAVGAVLLGPAGLLLGGLTGGTRHEEKVKRLMLKIYTNDLASPIAEVPFLDEWVGHPAGSMIVKHAARSADEWYGRFQAILHAQAQARVVEIQSPADLRRDIENTIGSASADDLRQAALTNAARLKNSQDRVQAIMARIEHQRLHGSRAKLEPRG